MKKIIIACALIGCFCCGCSSGVVAPDNNTESVMYTNRMLYTVEDRPEIAETETEVNTSESIMIEIMNELENNFRAAGFDVVRDSVNHITIK